MAATLPEIPNDTGITVRTTDGNISASAPTDIIQKDPTTNTKAAEAQSLYALGQECRQQGNNKDAIDYFNQALFIMSNVCNFKEHRYYKIHRNQIMNQYTSMVQGLVDISIASLILDFAGDWLDDLRSLEYFRMDKNSRDIVKGIAYSKAIHYYKAAIAMYLEIFSLKPNHIKDNFTKEGYLHEKALLGLSIAYKNLAHVLYRVKNFEEAIQFFQKAIETVKEEYEFCTCPIIRSAQKQEEKLQELEQLLTQAKQALSKQKQETETKTETNSNVKTETKNDANAETNSNDQAETQTEADATKDSTTLLQYKQSLESNKNQPSAFSTAALASPQTSSNTDRKDNKCNT